MNLYELSQNWKEPNRYLIYNCCFSCVKFNIGPFIMTWPDPNRTPIYMSQFLIQIEIFFWFRFFSCFFPYCTSSYVNKLLPVLASRCELFLLINSSSSLSTWLQTLSVFSFTQHRIAAFMEFRWIYFSIPKQTLKKICLSK